jgi:translation initiation factor IF-3
MFTNMEEKPISTNNFQGSRSPSQSGPLINEKIRAKEVLLIDDEGVNHGIVPTSKALEIASEKDLDLVVVSPNQAPPVAKILNYGKYKFEVEKRAKEAKKKQHTVDIKEIKMRYSIDVHDYNVRIKNIKKFISAGNKVKVVIMLKGREIQHTNLAFKLAERVKNDLSDENIVYEKQAGMEGRNVIMILSSASV